MVPWPAIHGSLAHCSALKKIHGLFCLRKKTYQSLKLSSLQHLFSYLGLGSSLQKNCWSVKLFSVLSYLNQWLVLSQPERLQIYKTTSSACLIHCAKVLKLILTCGLLCLCKKVANLQYGLLLDPDCFIIQGFHFLFYWKKKMRKCTCILWKYSAIFKTIFGASRRLNQVD